MPRLTGSRRTLRRAARATRETISQFPFATQLRHSEQRKQRPPVYDVEIMGNDCGPAVSLWPGSQGPNRAPSGYSEHRLA